MRQTVDYGELSRLCGVLTVGERAELEAIYEMNCAVKTATFIGKQHFEHYRPLIAAGLVDWGPAPGRFDKRQFAGVIITGKGMSFLDFIKAEMQT